MKQREKLYTPLDTRAARHLKERKIDVGDGGLTDELAALRAMRDSFAPDVNSGQERTDQTDRDIPIKDDAKGIER